MKNYYYTFEEALENIHINLENAANDYEKRNFEESIKNFPLSIIPKKDSENSKVITNSGLNIRILGYRSNLETEFPIIALVCENDGTETLVEYDKFGNCNLGDDYKLKLWHYYFEAGDYVASDDFIGILDNPYHYHYKFTKRSYDGKELYGYFQDAPLRICTPEEIKILDECFDESKYLEAIEKFK